MPPFALSTQRARAQLANMGVVAQRGAQQLTNELIRAQLAEEVDENAERIYFCTHPEMKFDLAGKKHKFTAGVFRARGVDISLMESFLQEAHTAVRSTIRTIDEEAAARMAVHHMQTMRNVASHGGVTSLQRGEMVEAATRRVENEMRDQGLIPIPPQDTLGRPAGELRPENADMLLVENVREGIQTAAERMKAAGEKSAPLEPARTDAVRPAPTPQPAAGGGITIGGSQT